MNNSRMIGKIGAGIAAVSLGLLGVGITATPASAEPINPSDYNITTSSVEWQYVEEQNGYIGDARSYNSDQGVWGWTDDAFDDMPDQFVVTEGAEPFWTFEADDVVRDLTEGGKSSLILTGHTGETFETDYTVTLTLTLEGNYARWAYVITGGDASGVDVFFTGNLGSDGGSTFVEDGNTLVSNDSRVTPEDAENGDLPEWEDPVLGFSVATDGEFTGYGVTEGDDYIYPGALGATTFTLTTVIADYEPTAGDEATAFVTSLVPTLDSTFGEAYAAVRAPLLTLDPITLTKGVAVNTTLAGVLSQELVDEGYLGTEAGQIGAYFENVPAGLTLTFSQDENLLPVFTLTGTPTESGEFAADATIYQIGARGGEDRIAPDDAIGQNPISATAAITVPVVDVPVVPEAPAAVKPALAATGFDGMVVVGFGGLAAAAGILLVATTRRRRA